MEMDIQVERGAKPLDQRDGAGVGSLFRKACLPDQMRGNHAVDDAEHLAHDRRTTGKQKTQGIRETEHPLTHGFQGQNLIDQ